MSQKKGIAIQEAPVPTNVQQLRSFLGLVNYYGKFIPNMSTICQPLNALLRQGVKWKWPAEAQQAFIRLREILASDAVLAHYDPELPLRLATDASPYGVGAVISHIMPSGEERPIAFASATLSEHERNYSQLDKEASSIIFGLRHFHQYLYARKFTLITDHQPLVSILHQKKEIPKVAAARLQRWATILSAHRYEIIYRSSKDHMNADCLSRLPIPSEQAEDVSSGAARRVNWSQMEFLPVTAADLATATSKDPVLAKVLLFMMQGWPERLEEDDLKPYFQ
eukprot:m.210275 g.210275  ORF g.210275 m.210275 type:complete len:281 (+) comp39743_c0_seq9:3016-3858(+)